MFRRFSTTDKLGQWQGMDSNHQHVPCNGRIAVEVTNMTYNLLLLYQLSYLAIFTAYNGQSLQWKSNWVEFHIHRKKVYWEFVLIRWTIDGLIAGGGIEPPFRAKEARELPLLHPASTRGVRVSNDFFVLCVPLGNFHNLDYRIFANLTAFW